MPNASGIILFRLIIEGNYSPTTITQRLRSFSAKG